MPSHDQHVLVTGAAGFLGTRVCQVLRERGSTVTALDLRASAGPWDSFFSTDVTQPIPPEPFAHQDTVFHLAGKVHALSELEQDDAEYYRANTEGTRNVLEASIKAGVRRFVFFSTIKAMTRDEAPVATDARGMMRPWSETDLVEPDTPYGKSKLEAERLVLQGGYVPEPVVLRLCMVYGPRGKGNLQKMVEAIRRNRFPPLPEVRNRRSMVHVDDVVQAALLVADHPKAVGQVFIVSDGQAYSTRQLYECICQALNRPVPDWTIPLWALKALGVMGDGIGRLRGRRFVFDSDALEKLVGSAWFSSEKIQSLLGFKARWTLLAALPEIVREVV